MLLHNTWQSVAAPARPFASVSRGLRWNRLFWDAQDGSTVFFASDLYEDVTTSDYDWDAYIASGLGMTGLRYECGGWAGPDGDGRSSAVMFWP